MLPRLNRLKTDRDFARLFRKGFGVSGGNLTLKYVVNGLANSRFGFVISTKVSKKATVRNLIRRRMRQVVRELLPELVVGRDIALIAKPSAKNLDYAQLATEMRLLFGKARLLGK